MYWQSRIDRDQVKCWHQLPFNVSYDEFNPASNRVLLASHNGDAIDDDDDALDLLS